MSVEDSAAELRDATTTSAPAPPVLRLRQNLSSCAKSTEGEDLDNAVSELVNFIDSVSESALSGLGNEEAQNDALQVLSEIRQFLQSPTLDQAVIDALSFELPKAVSRFAGVSDKCFELVDSVIDRFVELSSPRDMLPVLCELLALDSSTMMVNASRYVALILRGLSKVFLSIERRQFEQFKVAAPIVLNVLKAVCSELGGEETEHTELFSRALDIADSVHAASTRLERSVNEKLHALLGLYLLQITALLSLKIGYMIPCCISLMSRLSHFFPSCGLTYLGLLTGSDVDVITSVISGEEDDFISCLSYIQLGSSLSVIWGLASDDVAQAAGENLSALRDEIQNNQTTRWQAVVMLKHILVAVSLPWKLKRHAIDLLLSVSSQSNAKNDEQADCSLYMPGLFVSLQALTKFIMCEPTAPLRKDAFAALKRVTFRILIEIEILGLLVSLHGRV